MYKSINCNNNNNFITTLFHRKDTPRVVQLFKGRLSLPTSPFRLGKIPRLAQSYPGSFMDEWGKQTSSKLDDPLLSIPL